MAALASRFVTPTGSAWPSPGIKIPPNTPSLLIMGYFFLICSKFNTSTLTSYNWAVVACLFNSSHLPGVVAIDNAPLSFKPGEKSTSFSKFLYKSKEYFLILVIPADGPN